MSKESAPQPFRGTPPKLPQNRVPRKSSGAVAGQPGQSAFTQVRGLLGAPQPNGAQSPPQPPHGCPAPYPVLWNGAGPRGSGQQVRKHP